MGNIASELRIDSIMSTISSATAAPHYVSMEKCDKAVFICSIGTAAANLQSALSILQSATDSGAGAAITGATALIGSTAATRVNLARQALITMTTDATAGETLVINNTTFTLRTTVAAVSSLAEYGSTVTATTAAGGLDAQTAALATAINAHLSSVLIAATASTAAVRLTVRDEASTGIDIVSTGANQAPSYEMAQAAIEIRAADLNSTSKYVAMQLGTVATSIRANITVIRDGVRYKSPVKTFTPVTLSS